MFNEIEYNNDIIQFNELVISTVNRLLKEKGNTPGLIYFEVFFNSYMQRVCPAANELVNKYEPILDFKDFEYFKVVVQKKVEQGFNLVHHDSTQLFPTDTSQ